MYPTKRHKVFLSYHHDEDQEYKNTFARMMGSDIVDKSVKEEDIDDSNLPVDTIRRIIRDDFIADATVTVVLIGPCTWQRKHVDWEISSSLRDTQKNSRCGLLGILLPNHPNFGPGQYDPHLIPPRLAKNCQGHDPYARIYDWPGPWATDRIRRWIHQAFERRKGRPPNNNQTQFRRNRRGACLAGWQS